MFYAYAKKKKFRNKLSVRSCQNVYQQEPTCMVLNRGHTQCSKLHARQS